MNSVFSRHFEFLVQLWKCNFTTLKVCHESLRQRNLKRTDKFCLPTFVEPSARFPAAELVFNVFFFYNNWCSTFLFGRSSPTGLHLTNVCHQLSYCVSLSCSPDRACNTASRTIWTHENYSTSESDKQSNTTTILQHHQKSCSGPPFHGRTNCISSAAQQPRPHRHP
jgi:hypothetical protein